MAQGSANADSPEQDVYHLEGSPWGCCLPKALQLGNRSGPGNGYTAGFGDGLPRVLEAQEKQWDGGEFTDCFLGQVSPELDFVG